MVHNQLENTRLQKRTSQDISNGSRIGIWQNFEKKIERKEKKEKKEVIKFLLKKIIKEESANEYKSFEGKNKYPCTLLSMLWKEKYFLESVFSTIYDKTKEC